MKRRWTKNEEEILRNHLYEARPIYELFRILDRSPASVRNKAWTLGMTGTGDHYGRWWLPETRAELQKLWDDGLSVKAIAQKLHMTQFAIYGKIKRMGLKR